MCMYTYIYRYIDVITYLAKRRNEFLHNLRIRNATQILDQVFFGRKPDYHRMCEPLVFFGVYFTKRNGKNGADLVLGGVEVV